MNSFIIQIKSNDVFCLVGTAINYNKFPVLISLVYNTFNTVAIKSHLLKTGKIIENDGSCFDYVALKTKIQWFYL